MEEWKKCLVLAPEEIINKTLEVIMQLALDVKVDNHDIGRRYYKSRFLFLKHKRLYDEFHTDTFFPDAISAQRHICG